MTVKTNVMMLQYSMPKAYCLLSDYRGGLALCSKRDLTLTRSGQGYGNIPGQAKTESTDFLGKLWALSPQNAPSKAVSVRYIIFNFLSNFHSNIFPKCPN